MPDVISDDFVFGTLATDGQRVAQMQAAAAGVDHAHDLDPRDPLPGESVTIKVRLGPRVEADHVTTYYTTDGDDPAGTRGVASVGKVISLTRIAVDWDTIAWGYRETWAGQIPGQPDGTLVRYRIEAWSSLGGQSVWASEIAGVVAGERPPGVSDLDAEPFRFAGELWPIRRTASDAYHVDRETVPEWLKDAVIYEVFVDRFATTGGQPFATPDSLGGFFGGTLRGVLERLDHIVDLGATCLWLSPVFPSPSHHGYDPSDYRSVEPRLGSAEDLRALVDAAHVRGLRVILDLVANHMSSEHPAFRAATSDPDAPERRWFTFTRWPDAYLTFFGVQDHPQIDADDPGARRYLIDSAVGWLETGIDGFRCDYAQGPSHAFWSEFRAATRSVAPDSVTLGEVVETPALQRTYAGRLDGCLDFVLNQVLRQAFAFGTLAAADLETTVHRHLAYQDDGMVLPSFLDNHDMNRFLWVVRGDVRRLRLAALYQLTLPNPPIVYYGTEVGLSQVRDVRRPDGSGHPEESRMPMIWGEGQDRNLFESYRDLIHARRSMGSVWRGPRETLIADDDLGTLVVRCRNEHSDAVVAFGLDGHPRNLEHRLFEGRTIAFRTSPSVRLEGGRLTLGPFDGAILRSADTE
jgi:cyclomaltodextrinase / maltogenic alpha-amylase / neopullulanase